MATRRLIPRLLVCCFVVALLLFNPYRAQASAVSIESASSDSANLFPPPPEPNFYVTLQAGSGRVIEFQYGNGDILHGGGIPFYLPHLVLYQNGDFNLDESSRTLNMEVKDVPVIPGTPTTVAYKIITQHRDPDLGGAGAVPPAPPIIVWEDKQSLTIVPDGPGVLVDVSFSHAFEKMLDDGVTHTPTDYFRIEIMVNGEFVDGFGPDGNYHFLMDNEWREPLFNNRISGQFFDVMIYYSDMFGHNVFDMAPATPLNRSQTNELIEKSIIPPLQEAFDKEANDWGYGAPQISDDWDQDRMVEILLGSTSDEWYHGQMATGAHFPDLSNRVIAKSPFHSFVPNYASTDPDIFTALKNGYKGFFDHEALHTLQWNRWQVLEIDPPRNEAYIEAHAQVATSVINQPFEFMRGSYYMGGTAYAFLKKYLKGFHNSGDMTYALGFYWRFLYEQCGNNPNLLVQTHDFVLLNFHQQEQVTETYDRTLSHVLPTLGCSIDDHEDSLAAFSRAIYALRLNGSGYFYDPQGEIKKLAPKPTLSDIFYKGADKVTNRVHPGFIGASFGMDFVEFNLHSSMNNEFASLVFSNTSGDDEFIVQAWKVNVPIGGVPAAVGDAEVLSQTDANGNLVYTFAIDTNAATDAFNRLGVIITRIDTNDSTDPAGEYQIQLTNDADGDGNLDREECRNIHACWDTDKDDIPDYLDVDSDDDTIPDNIEVVCSPLKDNGKFPCNTDGTDYWDYRDEDSDNDGAPDKDEAGNPIDKNNFPLDSDKDGLPDFRDSDIKTVWGLVCSIFRGCSSTPGGDQPDDNHSASAFSPLPMQPLPPGTRAEPRVAVLKSGFHWATEYLVRSVGERTYWLDTDFDPAATVEKYPVLIIPSGGLYGMESSTSFRVRLEEYTRLGGVIVAFDQQHGYEYAALPGGQVGGFGWAEDNSCFSASLQIAQWHSLLSGFDHATLTAHVDGYFTSMPDNTQVLLARSANGKPGLILYPFGEGWVLATTIFDDWGAGNGQASADSGVLLRDLLAWAIDRPDTPDELPQYHPGEAVSFSIPIINTGDTPITSVQLDLVSPERQIIATQTISTEIGAGQTVDVPFTSTAAMPLGIWRVDVTKMNGVAVAGDPPSAIFAVANPVDPVTPNSSLLLSITAPADHFTPGSVAPFKFHVFNNSDTERTATIHYGLPHHTWESGDPAYGHFGNNSHTLTIPPHDEATYTWEVSVFTTDRLWASLSETVGGQVRTVSKAHFAVYPAYASATVSAASEPGRWMRNTPVTVTLTVTNTSQAPLKGSLVLRALDARNVPMGDPATLPLEVSAGGQDDVTHTLTVPSTVASGTAILSAVIQDSAGNVVGGGYAPFEVPFSPLSLELASLPTLKGGTAASIGVNVTNQSSDEAVEHGDLTLTLTTPDSGSLPPTSPVPFTVQASSTQTVTAPLELPALHFGQYTLRADTLDEYGRRHTQVTWNTRPWLSGTLDNYIYQAGETASLEMRIINPGPFELPLTVSVSTEFYNSSSTTLPDLQPYTALTHAFSIPIPADVETGGYPITLMLALPSGDTLTQVVAWLHVPPSELVCTFDEPDTAPQPGEALTAAIANVGGVGTSGTYRLELQDAGGNIMQFSDEALSNLDPNTPPQSVSIDIPPGLVAGTYTFICQSEDAETGDSSATSWPVQVDGVVASLSVNTDQPVYSSDEEIVVTADVDNTGAALPEGQLDLRITQGNDNAWSWEIYRADESPTSTSMVSDALSDVNEVNNVSSIGGLSSNWVASITVDTAGNVWNVWAGDYDYDQDRQISMLAADSTTWTTYTLPIGTKTGAVNDIVIDGQGRKWMATDQGVARLPADNNEDDWKLYTTTDGLASDYITSIAIDTTGNMWFGTDAGVSKLVVDTNQWKKYTYDTTNHKLASDMVYAVEVDSSGNIWFGTEAGLSKLALDETWTTYTSGLLSNRVSDIAFDEAGNVWMATPATSPSAPGGVSMLKVEDESIKNYIPPTNPGTMGLASKYVTSVEVDIAGRTWIGHEMMGVDVLMPDGRTWMHFSGGEAGELSGNVINDIASSPNGDVWLATQPLYRGANDGGVTRAYNAKPGKQVVWRNVSSIDLEETTGAFDGTWSLYPQEDLGTTGKFLLEAKLTSPTGQHIADDEKPFYVFPPGVELRLETSTRLCRPGQPIELTATVKNTGAVLLTERRLVFWQDDNTIFTSDPFALEPAEEKIISYSATAPASTGLINFTASVNIADFRVTEAVEVGSPIVTVDDTQIPALVGRETFKLPLILKNTGPLDAAVDVLIEFPGQQGTPTPTPITVPAGQVYRFEPEDEYQITQDTVFTFTFSGDFSQTLEHTVTFGEALEAEFSPDEVYPEGFVAIPYTLTNTGQLARVFTTTVDIQPSDTSPDDSITAYLLPGQVTSGTLSLDLDAGDYTLTYTTPFGEDSEPFRVVPPESATLDVTAGQVVGSRVTLTAQLVNTGFTQIDGMLQVETPFTIADYPVSLELGDTEDVEVTIDLSLAEVGAYPIVARLLSSTSLTLATDTVSIDVPGPELVLTGIPGDTPVTAGEAVTLTFEVENRGSAPAMAEIAVKLGDLLDETNSVWLPSSESGEITFSFQAPDGLTGDRLTGEFWFEGERYDLSLPIAGLSLEVSAAWDQPVYAADDTATLTITVANLEDVAAPPLYAHVSYNGEFFTQPLVLTASDTESLTFELTADAGADPKVFYAIYETAEQRGVYLNTTYLYLNNQGVTIVPDRTVYHPGDTVHAMVYTSLNDATLTVSAPGLEATPLPLAGQNQPLDFTLPADLLRGTYTIDYVLGEAVYSTPFDVDAVWVRVTEARLLDTLYTPDDQVVADLTVASTAALDVSLRAWLLYPDGTQSEEITEPVSLDGIANNHIQLELDLETDQAGPHRLVYLLVDPGDAERVYAAGSETFDVGAAQVLGIHTDRESYPLDSDPVTATVTLYAEQAMSVHLDLLLDGAVVDSRDIPLAAGAQTRTIPVPAPISPADHVLGARLQVGALEHSASAGFAYGTEVVDLLPGSPQIITTEVGMRTVRAYIYNTGQTASGTSSVQIWDGDPAGSGTLIGEQSLPALAPGAIARIDVTWNVLGQAGLNTLTVLADPDNQVTEYNEDNNAVTREVTVPDFDLEIESSASTYDEGQPVPVTLHAANLTQSAASLEVTTTAETTSEQVVFTDVLTLTIPAASQVSQVITWNTAQAANQEYLLRARGDAEIDSNVLTVTVENVAPLVDAGPDQVVDVGDTVGFTGSKDDPGLADTHTISWDFGDGTTANGTLTPSHVYTGSGTYIVTLRVTDNDGGVGSDTLTATVSNAAPVVDAGADAAVAEGDTFSGAGSFTDPDEDTWTATVDYGDGSGVQPLTLAGYNFDLAHTYADNGVYTVEVCVADDNSGIGCDTLIVTVSNVAPVVDAGADREIAEGDAFGGLGSFTDPGADVWTATVNYGDGTGTQPLTLAGMTFSLSHIYVDNGAYAVTVCVADDDSGSGCDTRTVTVSNVVPDVQFFGQDNATVGEEVAFTGSFADPGSADTHTIAWDFGDGHTLTGTLTAAHSFSTHGVYTVTLTVTDDDGGVGVWDSIIEVSSPANTYVVTSTGDKADSNTGDGICRDSAGACTLRAAIQQANATAGTDIIAFNLSGSGPYTIQPRSPLPTISDPVVIDGTTQPGYAGMPRIQLDGSRAGTGANGLTITAGDSTVRGLAINRFANTGIQIETLGGNTLTANLIGTNPAGTAALGNGNGVRIIGSSNNTIGGISPAERNVVSGNTWDGIYLHAQSSGNQIEGNYIGTDVTGTLALGNRGSGVSISGSNNIVGGTAPGAGNVISGNGGVYGGIYIRSGGNRIEGNYIGTDVTGTLALGNRGNGVTSSISNNIIGGTAPGAGNIISGNDLNGVFISVLVTETRVEGNYIGTDVTGTLALGNGGSGVSISGSNNIIGGTAPGAGNVISGNNGNGVVIGMPLTPYDQSGNRVEGNFIGTDVSGNLDIGNFSSGVYLWVTSNNTIGGTAVAAGNVIAYNGGDGVHINVVATGSTIQGNAILSNAGLGIDLDQDGVTPNDPDDADTGSNRLQNYPVLSAATTNAVSTIVDGTLNSSSSTAFTLDFYASPTCDPSGYGEGQLYLGTGQVTTDGSGNAGFSITVPVASPDGWVITATATDPGGNTSEFSACRAVVPMAMSTPAGATVPLSTPGEMMAVLSIPELWYGRRRTRGF